MYQNYHRSHALHFFLLSLEEDFEDFGVCLLDDVVEEVEDDADEDGACLPPAAPSPPPRPAKSLWNSVRKKKKDNGLIINV